MENEAQKELEEDLRQSVEEELTKTTNPKEKSNCCQAPIETSCADEGTCCYICTSCKRPCDVSVSEELKQCSKCLCMKHIESGDVCEWCSVATNCEKISSKLTDRELREEWLKTVFILLIGNAKNRNRKSYHIWSKTPDEAFVLFKEKLDRLLSEQKARWRGEKTTEIKKVIELYKVNDFSLDAGITRHILQILEQ